MSGTAHAPLAIGFRKTILLISLDSVGIELRAEADESANQVRTDLRHRDRAALQLVHHRAADHPVVVGRISGAESAMGERSDLGHRDRYRPAVLYYDHRA